MRLNEITKDGLYRVKELDCDNDCIARLMTLGLLPEQEIRLVHEAPLGDPIAIEFNGCQMSLRLADAAGIEVEAV
ncbi:FeoA family protein [Coraliomargarita akajimensis]|uniref:FeoA family protein n=1 Tax=Coraliomargarita akajimensis (strain DSM 45221 / IAM 15411 / JCM 23193 / KCTC 12865 / 04OKA010-24) TaxID=583355 RepID=D5EQL7_CORAD|nr:FeoA family protein [Coraliomargarita akajimensis]ADE55831.1 FeoA family protein [Coraliomargarita akajimensis DSM 45221]